MGYLFTALVVLFGSGKGYFGKKISTYTKQYDKAVLANVLRMLICILIGFFFVLFQGGLGNLQLNLPTFLISLLSGISTSTLLVFWLISVRRGAYILLDVFLTVSVIVPITLSAIIFNESVNWNDFVGLALLFIATGLMCIYNNKIKTKLTVSTFMFLLIMGVSQGLASFSQKLYINAEKINISVVGNNASFNFYTYVFSFIVLFTFYILSTIKTPKKQANESAESQNEVAVSSDTEKNYSVKEFIIKTLPFMTIMAILLFLDSYVSTLALKYLEATIFTPLRQGGCLLVAVAMSSIFFKEKIKLVSIIGIFVAILGLVIINVF